MNKDILPIIDKYVNGPNVTVDIISENSCMTLLIIVTICDNIFELNMFNFGILEHTSKSEITQNVLRFKDDLKNDKLPDDYVSICSNDIDIGYDNKYFTMVVINNSHESTIKLNV